MVVMPCGRGLTIPKLYFAAKMIPISVKTATDAALESFGHADMYNL